MESGIEYSVELNAHAFALEVSGYTHLPQIVGRTELDKLRQATDRALDASRAAIHAGNRKYLVVSDQYHAARCLYCWGDSMLELLNNTTIEQLAQHVMGEHQLWDMAAQVALPSDTRDSGAQEWHRDFGAFANGEQAMYLWCFLCLDDVSPDNGATSIIPGSHRLGFRRRGGDVGGHYPSAVQLCAAAGDLLVMNPAAIHSAGVNHTRKERRLLNVGLCHTKVSPLLNHWAIAGPQIRQRAGDRLRSLLGAERDGLDDSWPALPDGWVTEPGPED